MYQSLFHSILIQYFRETKDVKTPAPVPKPTDNSSRRRRRSSESPEPQRYHMATRNNIPIFLLLENHQKEMIIDRDRHYEILKSQTEKNPAVNHRHQKRTK